MNFPIKHLFAAALITTLIVSCSGDNDSSSVNNNALINSITNTAKQGTWRITTFIDSGNDETDHFAMHNFTFEDDGVVTVSTPFTYTGSWSVTDSDNSSDDSPDDNDVDFNLFFADPAPTPYADLNDDWDIIEVTADKIRLTDVSGGNGGTDFLTFEKIN